MGQLIFDKYKDNPLPTVTEGVAPYRKQNWREYFQSNITTDSIAVTPERPNVTNEMASLESSSTEILMTLQLTLIDLGTKKMAQTKWF